jgi:hypothetical protein
MIDRSGHSERTHFMSHDYILHIELELNNKEILDGEIY